MDIEDMPKDRFHAALLVMREKDKVRVDASIKRARILVSAVDELIGCGLWPE
jgi:hypothetical protein